MDTTSVVLLVIAVVAIVVVVGLLVAGRRRGALRERFGPEYERAVEAEGSPRAADAQLRARVKERRELEVHALSGEARTSYRDQWLQVQGAFVDRPDSALGEADALVERVMRDRGYPVDDFDRQAELISVDHPAIVEHYRVAHGVFGAAGDDGTSTEDMRRALVAYRELFTELLGESESGAEPDQEDTEREDSTTEKEATR